MSVKVLSIALVAAIIALPVPASQMLVGHFSSPAPVANTVPGTENLGLLLQDPFLVDTLSYSAPASFLELETGVDPHAT